MCIWNKILLGLIIVALLPLFYLSARMLKTHKYWRDLVQKHEVAINNLQKEDRILRQGGQVGGEFKPGIEQVSAELRKLIVDRQRVWFNCTPTVNVNKQTGEVSVKVAFGQGEKTTLANKTILYAFEEAGVQQHGRYLGEFKVASIADKQATLEPAIKLLPKDREKLSSTKGTWVLYESLPHDEHDIFAALGEDDKKVMFPADSMQEYVKDGQAVADGKYVRQLRNYGYLFDEYRLQIAILGDLEQSAIRDQKLLEDTLADAKKQVEFYTNQETVFQAVATKFIRQRDTVKNHLDKVTETLEAAKAAVENLLKNNKAMAGQIARIQWEATQRIDQRTHAMAQSDK